MAKLCIGRLGVKDGQSSVKEKWVTRFKQLFGGYEKNS